MEITKYATMTHAQKQSKYAVDIGFQNKCAPNKTAFLQILVKQV